MFRKCWPSILTRNLNVGQLRYKSVKNVKLATAESHAPFCAGIDRFILAISDRRRTKVMNDILLYINPQRPDKISC